VLDSLEWEGGVNENNNQKLTSNSNTPPADDRDSREQRGTERLATSKPERITLNRRDFLKIAGVTVAVVAAGAGGVTVVKMLIQNQLRGPAIQQSHLITATVASFYHPAIGTSPDLPIRHIAPSIEKVVCKKR
jgi:hypothetical protein